KAQTLGLADVDHAALAVAHDVDARLERESLDEGLDLGQRAGAGLPARRRRGWSGWSGGTLGGRFGPAAGALAPGHAASGSLGGRDRLVARAGARRLEGLALLPPCGFAVAVAVGGLGVVGGHGSVHGPAFDEGEE